MLFKVTKQFNCATTIDIELNDEDSTKLFDCLKNDAYSFFMDKYDSCNITSEVQQIREDGCIEWVSESYIIYNKELRIEITISIVK